MSTLPSKARAVVVGCGIVGNSVAYHLTDQGWSDVVLLDKGPLPNPGGSTGHASNFIFPVDHSKEMTQLTLESVRQYRDAGVFTQSGGIEVARTEERMQELQRRMASAKAWGIDDVSLLTPAQVKELVPFIEESVILGGFYTPSVGIVDSLRFGKIARMAGASIPLTPAVHQMIDVGPVPHFRDTKGVIEFPIVRDMDTNMYERQDGSGLEIGSYAHRPILHDPEEIPSNEEAALSPTELPFTQEDFEQQMEDALELIPEVLNDESVGIKYAINGLLSLTPDGLPLLGETDVKGLWSAAAVWVKEGPGVGKAMAEWMTHGESEIDLQSSDIARFYECQKSRTNIRARAAEGFNKTYGIVHPSEQWESNRRVRMSPFYEREQSLGAVFYEAAAWERPHWYESNAGLVDEYGVQPREHEWDARWWSPIINAEHLAMRDRAAMFDLTAFSIFDVVGANALDSVQQVAARQMNVPNGRVVYTPVLSPSGTFKSDLTIMKMDDDRFRVVTGGAHGMADKKWFADHLVGDARIEDHTSTWTTLGLWGPRARDILAAITGSDVSNDAFPFSTWQELDNGAIASRISYVGDLGWELYVPMEKGVDLWDAVWEAGQPHRLVPAGIGVYGTTGRLEKAYRAFGFELDADFTVVEADMAWWKVKTEDFVGKEAHLAHRDAEPVAKLCTLTIDDHTTASGVKRYPLGREPVTLRDGTPLADAHGRRSYVTSAGAGPSVGKHIVMSYLPPEHANAGEQLAVEYMTELLPATVEIVGSTPPFDPGNDRIRS